MPPGNLQNHIHLLIIFFLLSVVGLGEKMAEMWFVFYWAHVCFSPFPTLNILIYVMLSKTSVFLLTSIVEMNKKLWLFQICWCGKVL